MKPTIEDRLEHTSYVAFECGRAFERAGFFIPDSMAMHAAIVAHAEQFSAEHAETDWCTRDYIEAIAEHAEELIAEHSHH